MNRHEMQYVLVLGVTQESSTLLLDLETLRRKPNPHSWATLWHNSNDRWVLRLSRPQLYKAFWPLADGVSVTTELGGDDLVGGILICRGQQDDATAKDQRLGC